MYSKFNGKSTLNNLPFFINELNNGTYIISFYQQRIAFKDIYGDYYAYYNPDITHSTGNHLSKVITVSINDKINDIETMGNQEVLEPSNLSSALQSGILEPKIIHIFHYIKAYGIYYNYNNNSLLKANITWLNAENNKIGKPNINVLIAENKYAIMYTFNAISDKKLDDKTIFTVYWSPLYYNGNI